MGRSGSVSSGFLVGGMFFILVSAYIALYTFSKMHYVSEVKPRTKLNRIKSEQIKMAVFDSDNLTPQPQTAHHCS
jgi:hypothetical protein